MRPQLPSLRLSTIALGVRAGAIEAQQIDGVVTGTQAFGYGGHVGGKTLERRLAGGAQGLQLPARTLGAMVVSARIIIAPGPAAAVGARDRAAIVGACTMLPGHRLEELASM